MTSFGIDFGTTNSVLAACDRGAIETISLDEPPADWAALGFDKVLPSVIGMPGDGKPPIFGWDAKRMQENKLAAVKRILATEDTVEIGGHSFRVEEAGATLFKHIQAKGFDAGVTLDQAVVTIPANSRGAARLRTKVAAGLAGIEVLALINEPTAAAMAYSREIENDQRVLVFDFGGGTLDVTILQSVHGVFIEQASKGIQRLGGLDVDQELEKLIMSQLGSASNGWSNVDRSGFALDVERAKILLSSSDRTSVQLPGGGFHEVTRADFNNAIRPLIDKSRGPIDQCLRDLGSGVTIDHVVMVGGSSKIPAVRDFVSEILGQAPMAGVDPMTAIAEGASLAAGILNDEVDDFDFFVSTEHALGTIVVNPETGQESFSVLVPRNAVLPADRTDSYTPIVDYTEQLTIRVIEGDPELEIEHEDNVILKEWDVKLAEPRPASEASIDITYKYDVDGILRVAVRDKKTGVVLMDEELGYGPERKRDLASMRRNLDSVMGAGSTPSGESSSPNRGLDAESQELVDKVEQKIIPFVDEDEQGRLNGIIADLKSATDDTKEECKRRLGAALREHAYLL